MDVICGKLTMWGNTGDTKYGNNNLILGGHLRFTFKKFVFSDLSTLCATIRNLGKLMGSSKTQTTEYK